MNALGYLISTVSVIFLGLAAWPSMTDDNTKTVLIIVGAAASVVGMFLRYLSHREQQREIRKARASS